MLPSNRSNKSDANMQVIVKNSEVILNFKLDIAIAKCQRATNEKKYSLVMLKNGVMFCGCKFHDLCALPLVRCKTKPIHITSLESQESYLTDILQSLEIFSACTILSHGSIMLPPRQPRVFARLARWQ